MESLELSRLGVEVPLGEVSLAAPIFNTTTSSRYSSVPLLQSLIESSYRPPAIQGTSSGYLGQRALPYPTYVLYRRVHIAHKLFRLLPVGLYAIRVIHQSSRSPH